MSHPYPPRDPYGAYGTDGAWQEQPAGPPQQSSHPSPYAQPGPAPYGWVQGWHPPPQAVSTNGMAIASLVLGILWLYWIGSVLAVAFGHVALRQVRHDPYQSGHGMAVAGLVLGYLGVAVLALVVIFLVAAGLSASSPGVRSLLG